MLRTLNKGGRSHALLESPTGSGKSMAILCGVLAWLEVEKKRVSERVEEMKQKNKEQKGAQEPAPLEGQSKRAKLDCEDCAIGCSQGVSQDPNDEQLAELTVPKVYIASRTHKQLGQLVKELKRTGYSPRYTVLGSRNQYCVNERVRQQKDINEACKDNLKECQYYGKNLNKVIEEFNRLGLSTNMDVEDLVKYGKQKKACPYFLSRELATHAEIIFAPYNYIMDPGIRSAMSINMENSIVIVDEAHNVEDTCRSAGSFEISSDSLYAVQTELNVLLTGTGEKAVKMPEAHRSLLHVSSIFHTWINTNTVSPSSIKMFEEKVDIWADQDIRNTLKNLGVVPDTLSQWQKHLEGIVTRSSASGNVNKRRGAFDQGEDDDILLSSGSCRVFQGLFNTLDLMLNQDRETLDSYRMVRIQKIKSDKTQRRIDVTLGFWCLSPDVIFRPLASKVKSVILTSGTLSPLSTFASELFCRFDEQLEAEHIIDPEQVWVGCLPNSPRGLQFVGKYQIMETLQFQDDLANGIITISKIVPFGVLVFLPSYAFMEKLINRMKITGLYEQLGASKRIFIEPRSAQLKEFENLMRKYYECISACKTGAEIFGKNSTINGAIFFAVYRGKISEGLDLADENCRAVIPVGIPYPAVNDQKVKLKRDFNDAKSRQKGLLNGQLWYETQAFRALNQALGRCIRHRFDWGAIILLEQRFTFSRNSQQLSKWVRNRVTIHNNFDVGMESLRKFVKENQAKEAEVSAQLSEMRANMRELQNVDANVIEDEDVY